MDVFTHALVSHWGGLVRTADRERIGPALIPCGPGSSPVQRGSFITGLSTMNGHSLHVITSRQEKSAARHNNKIKNGAGVDRGAPSTLVAG